MKIRLNMNDGSVLEYPRKPDVYEYDVTLEQCARNVMSWGSDGMIEITEVIRIDPNIVKSVSPTIGE